MKGNKIKVGDLIRISDWKGSKPDGRSVGTVITLSDYKPSHKMKYQLTESLSEVLWQDGSLGWILTERLSLVGDKEWKE